MDILIRKAKLNDAIGISEVFKVGLKRKTFIYTGTNKYTKKRLEKLRNNLSSKSSTFTVFVAIDKKTKKIIGQVSYDYKKEGRQRHSIHLGWGIHPDYEGKGIGTKLLKSALEDAKKKGFKRAEAEISIKNVASWKIALKNGFKIEGTKKKGHSN